MKSPIKLVGLLGALAIVAGACSGPSTTSAPTSVAATQPAGTEVAASTGPAPLTGTLTIWQSYASGGGELTAFNKVLDAVKAANPGLTINNVTQPFDQMFKLWDTDVLAGGTSADMFIAPNDNLYSQAAATTILNINDKLTGKLEGFSETSVNGSKADIGDGKGPQFYMVPESLKAVALWYDKTAITTPPTSTDALLAGVKDGSIKLGLNQNAYHMFGFSGSFGGTLMDATGKCIADQGGFADAFKYFQDLKAAGAKFYTNNGGDITPDLNKGTINAVVDGPWQTADFTDATKGLGDKAAVVAIPAGPTGSKADPFTGTDGWYINPNSPNVDLAIQFALLMVGTANEQVMADGAGHVPAAPGVTINSDIVQGFADAAAAGLPRPQTKQFGNYWGPFGDAVNAVIDKAADPAATVANACKLMNQASGL